MQTTETARPANRQERRHPEQVRKYVTAAELAERWAVTPQHIYNLVGRGLPSVKIGRSRRFDPEVADAWVEAAA